jgi:uncharacterized membrane protein YhaH (DUF805 family)
MRGSVIGFDVVTATGAINGLDGNRYEFARTDWRAATEPAAGDEVDFSIEGQTAKAIFLIAPASVTTEPFRWKEFLLWSSGRISRSQYWLRWMLPYFVVYVICWVLDVGLGTTAYSRYHDQPGILCGILSLLAIWPSVVTALKRIHDHGRSGWFYLVLLIPVVQLWPAIEIMFLRGTKGPNRFGPDPLGKD